MNLTTKTNKPVRYVKLELPVEAQNAKRRWEGERAKQEQQAKRRTVESE